MKVSVTDLIGNYSTPTFKVNTEEVSNNLAGLIIDNTNITFNNVTTKLSNLTPIIENCKSNSNEILNINITNKKTTANNELTITLPGLKEVTDIVNGITDVTGVSLQSLDSIKSLTGAFINPIEESILQNINTDTSKKVISYINSSLGQLTTLASGAINATDSILNIFGADEGSRISTTVSDFINGLKKGIGIIQDNAMINLDKKTYYNNATDLLSTLSSSINNAINLGESGNAKAVSSYSTLLKTLGSLSSNIYAFFKEHNSEIFNFSVKKNKNPWDGMNFDSMNALMKRYSEIEVNDVEKRILLSHSRVDNIGKLVTDTEWYVEVEPYEQGFKTLPPNFYDFFSLDTENRWKLPIISYQIIDNQSNVLASKDMYSYDNTKYFINSIIQKAETLILNFLDYHLVSGYSTDNISAIDAWNHAYLQYVNQAEEGINMISRFYKECCYIITVYRYGNLTDVKNKNYNINKYICLPFNVKLNKYGSNTINTQETQVNFAIVGRLSLVGDVWR